MRVCPLLTVVSLSLLVFFLCSPHTFGFLYHYTAALGRGGTVLDGRELRGQLFPCQPWTGIEEQDGAPMGDTSPGLRAFLVLQAWRCCGAVLEVTPTHSDSMGRRWAVAAELGAPIGLHGFTPPFACSTWRWGPGSASTPHIHGCVPHRATHPSAALTRGVAQYPIATWGSYIQTWPFLGAEPPQPHACPLLQPHTGVGSSAAP